MLGSRRALVVVIAAALTGGLAAPAAAQVSRPCVGSDTMCEAAFSMSGGASNERITVRLPDTNLRLLSVNATPAFVHGAYMLTRGRFSEGGSVYTATLDAVQGMPRNARLLMTFGHPSTGLSCGNIRRGVSFLTIAQIGSVRPGSFRCSVAKAVGRTWLARFTAHRSVQRFAATGITFRCRLIPLLPQNQQCQGGNLVVRFSGPTG
ncbi:MAG TPA: hypothetical protein VI122_02990 [Thermoleophilaceae bacterium]|jgi:hypothetical protein